ncbi:MAG TPA: ribonuclease HII [Anaerolineae bacterium]|nr:ribonuclease HII [Anaerolineae bacterium]
MGGGPSLDRELALRGLGYRAVAGIDEVGRGAWAGPVVACATILPLESDRLSEDLIGIRDSKHLTPRRRLEFCQRIREVALAVGVGLVSSAGVDELGIAVATRLAMSRALNRLPVPPEYLLIDGFPLSEHGLPQEAIVRGDMQCASIAAASVVAKVVRDSMMVALDGVYPGYGFAQHKGYGTADHREALGRKRLSPVHRHSFSPMSLLADQIAAASQQAGVDRSRSGVGRRGEQMAARYLEEEGQVICQTNYRCTAGEMDIVALDDDCLVFVEVRTRRSDKFGTPAESITAAKKRKLIEVAQTYLQENESLEVAWRIDVASIQMSRKGEVEDLTLIRSAVEG